MQTDWFRNGSLVVESTFHDDNRYVMSASITTEYICEILSVSVICNIDVYLHLTVYKMKKKAVINRYLFYSGEFFNLIWFVWILWHINYCRLFNAKYSLYKYIGYIRFDLVWFYGISTNVGYLMPNPLYTYILNIHDLVWFSLVLRHINHWRLFNAKSFFYIYIKYMINKHIWWIKFLNKSIFCTLLNGSKFGCVSLTIQLSISHLFTHR